MTIQEAIQKAVEEGYHVRDLDGIEAHYSGANTEYSAWTRPDNASSLMLRVEETFLDPLFWQALGQALGWQEGCSPFHLRYDQWWKQPWHRFIDHIAEGNTPESFFETL